MTDVIPLRIGDVTGSDVEELQELKSGEKIPIAHGGTGVAAGSLTGLQQGIELEKGVDIPSLPGGKVPQTQLPDATASAKGIVQLAEDLGGSAAAPQVVGLKGEVLPTLAVGYLRWTGSVWEFNASSGTGTVNPGAGIGTATDKMAYCSNAAGTEILVGPTVKGLAKGRLYAGLGGASTPTELAPGDRGRALLSTPATSSGLGYGIPRPMSSTRQHWNIRPNSNGPWMNYFGLSRPPSYHGNMSIVKDDDGTWARFAFHPGSTVGEYAGISFVGFDLIHFRDDPILNVRIRTPNIITDQRWWIGWFNTIPSGKTDPTTGDSWCGIRYISTSDSGQWVSYTNNGGASPSKKSTGVTVATSTIYNVTIEKTGTNFDFYINDDNTARTTHTAADAIPAESTGASLYVFNRSTAGSTRFIDIQLVDVSHL